MTGGTSALGESVSAMSFGRNTTNTEPSLGNTSGTFVRPSGVVFASGARRRLPVTGSHSSQTFPDTRNVTLPRPVPPEGATK